MYAGRLLELGIDTPQPVAYIESKKKGLFTTGYFISEYLPYKLMRDAYNEIQDSEKRRLTKDFIDFTLEMHSKKVLPLDFNSNNIFYHFYAKKSNIFLSLVIFVFLSVEKFFHHPR